MARTIFGLIAAALVVASASAQDVPYRSVLISAKDNVAAPDSQITVASVLGKSDIPGTITLRTLRGGKQEGVRIVSVDNGALTIDIIPTRGMGILAVTLNAETKPGDRFRLGWQSPVAEIVHPKFFNLNLRGGLGWLGGDSE